MSEYIEKSKHAAGTAAVESHFSGSNQGRKLGTDPMLKAAPYGSSGRNNSAGDVSFNVPGQNLPMGSGVNQIKPDQAGHTTHQDPFSLADGFPGGWLGRPSDYSLELVSRICSRIADGESLKSICLAEDMPTKSSVYLWLAAHKEFSDMYTRAKEDCADTLADEILEISDDGSNDWMAKNDPDNPGWQVNGEHINRSRLRVDSRKWIAAKLKPRKYGEKVAVGGDAEAPPIRYQKVERVLVRANPPDRDG